MSPVATATFTFDLWESEPVLEAEGSQLARTTMAKTFTGDLVGISGTADITRHEDGSHAFTLDYDLP